MVLYGITLVPLEEELMDTDTTLLSSLYTNYAAFDGNAQRSAAQLRLLMDRGEVQGYLYELAKSLFIADNLEEKEVARQEFEQAGLNINDVDGSRCLGAFLGTKEELEDWVQTKVESWAHGVHTLAKTAGAISTSQHMPTGDTAWLF